MNAPWVALALIVVVLPVCVVKLRRRGVRGLAWLLLLTGALAGGVAWQAGLEFSAQRDGLTRWWDEHRRVEADGLDWSAARVHQVREDEILIYWGDDWENFTPLPTGYSIATRKQTTGMWIGAYSIVVGGVLIALAAIGGWVAARGDDPLAAYRGGDGGDDAPGAHA